MTYLSQLKLPGEQTIEGPEQVQNLSQSAGPFGQNIIKTGITVLFTAAILLALFFLIRAGFLWMTSGGSKEEIDKAKKALIYSVLGLGLVFLSFLVVNIVGGFFKIKFF